MEPVDPRIDPAFVLPGSRAVVIAEHQDEYKNLPSVVTPDGQVITRWEPTPAERHAIALGEDVFVTILSGGQINPLYLTVGPVDWR